MRFHAVRAPFALPSLRPCWTMPARDAATPAAGRRAAGLAPAGLPSAGLLAAGLLLVPTASAAQQPRDPVADPAAVVVSGNARFTVLTPRMLRLEWAEDGRFEDRASLVFLTRRLPVPAYATRTVEGWLEIDTGELLLRYREGSGRFAAENLEVRSRGAAAATGADGGGEIVFRWRPGAPDTANLRGTRRTLDGARGAVELEPGLLSKDGWVLVDDTERPLFDDSEWPWVVQRPAGERQDWYFFGYGRDYPDAIRDFTKVAGRVPMPPRFALGYWWSRYWAYTDREFMDLVRQFDTFDVPIDVLVIDMDWHETFEMRWRSDRRRDQAGQRLGWTGYTWNETYFPDPEAFLAWTEERNLKTPLNLHPASGIQPHEVQYPAMARAMGIDPATQEYVPFRIEDKRFARSYFDIVIDPLEAQGVDFWWLDWQQWHETSIPGLTPTWWLNYVFFTEMEREREARPIIYHRWGGLGNHRYQIGFSGDAYSTWEALAFQPYFTATAANVLYGWWSHDIGGHVRGEVSPELYTRWVQFGIFSPILRTHTTKNPAAERRIWAYPPEHFQVMRDAFRLRYALVPYVYTEARKTFESGLALVRPMYYAHPWDEEAYEFTGQYLFGDDMLVSPVVDSMAPDTLLAAREVWLPEGEWYEWFTGTRLSGPAVVRRAFALDEIPVWVRAGAILPMAPPMERTDARALDPLVLTIFPGDSGSTRVYEDPGNSLDYATAEHAWTPVRQARGADAVVRIVVGAVEGGYAGMPSERGYELRFPGTWPPEEVRWRGRSLPYGGADTVSGAWTYDGQRLTTVVRLPPTPVAEGAMVDVRFPPGRDDSLLDGVPGRLSRMARAMGILNTLWPTEWSPESLIDLVQTGNRMTLRPGAAEAELLRLRSELPAALEDVRGMRGDRAVIARALAHLDAPGPPPEPPPTDTAGAGPLRR